MTSPLMHSVDQTQRARPGDLVPKGHASTGMSSLASSAANGGGTGPRDRFGRYRRAPDVSATMATMSSPHSWTFLGPKPEIAASWAARVGRIRTISTRWRS